MLTLTETQQQAVNRSPEFPAQLTGPRSQQGEALLRADDFDWVRALLGDEPDAPRRVDPRTGILYALLPEERYERFRAFFEEDPLTEAEKNALLREAGRRAGWDGPAWKDEETR